MASFKSMINTSSSRTFMVQKVVIPKEAVNPGSTIVIEIPKTLQCVPILLAKRQASYRDEILNARWNQKYIRNSVDVNKQETSYEAAIDFSSDGCIQTSATEVNASIQADGSCSECSLAIQTDEPKYGEDSVYTTPRASMNERHPESLSYNSVDKVASSQSTRQVTDLRSKYEESRANSAAEKTFPKCVKEPALAEYQWTKHDCKIQRELSNLLSDIKSIYN